jgi:hypothetical protein
MSEKSVAMTEDNDNKYEVDSTYDIDIAACNFKANAHYNFFLKNLMKLLLGCQC